MSTTLIEIRRAKTADAPAVAATHDAAWRNSYQGIIPGPELEKLINRRGPGWWENAIAKGSRVALLSFGDRIAGYANYGRNRARSLFYDGEIYELYLCPEFQGLGFGRRSSSIAHSAAAPLRAPRSGSGRRASTRSRSAGRRNTARRLGRAKREPGPITTTLSIASDIWGYGSRIAAIARRRRA
jgi:GNAT superfamily N-acetyltransferase